MAEITASMVKELRERTGAGMMEAKRALEAAGGSIDAAIKHLRESGALKAEKKAGRATNEGRIGSCVEGGKAALAEIQCETDFVARNDKFIEFVNKVAKSIVKAGKGDGVEALPFVDGGTIGDAIKSQVATIGENIKLGKTSFMSAPEGFFGLYIHSNGKIGVLVKFRGASSDAALAVAKQVAMHAAGHDPQPIALTGDQIPKDLIEQERAIYRKQAETEGKPANILDKIADGKLKAYFKKVALVEQEFVLDPKKTVKDLVKEAGDVKIEDFIIITVS
ncbi:MAG: translation elongation factor Ts [Planctomycetes bacterium]|nr:translation elongation factor Ts [Planctomycetota bacterium]